jgi:hypothetical protein
VILKILFFFLIFGLIARLFFGPRRWVLPGPYWAGRWGEGHGPGEERLARWHEEAHRGDPSPKPDEDAT